MTSEDRRTPEEEAFADLMEKSGHRLSEAARTILKEADSAAYAENLVRSYCYGPEEYEEAMEKMRIAASKITEEDRRLLAKIVHAGKAVADSIDSDDETRGDIHWYYKMAFSMVEKVLQELREVQKGA